VAANIEERPRKMTTERASRFWDNLADKYVADPIKDVSSYERKLEVTRSYFRPDMELLEFGCGSGATALLHAPFVKHIRAIDFSARMIEIATSTAAQQGVANVSFEVADITKLDVPEGSVDMVLGLSVLHLMEDRERVIAKVHRILKPGGVFVSSTTCLGDHMGYFRYIAPVGRALGLLPILNVMTRDELAAGIERAGFSIVHNWQPGRDKAVFIVARKAGA
jgi:ubiquinone/menaquinone biosynthesis C-methylase UbiE